jgi:hypothetical protein
VAAEACGEAKETRYGPNIPREGCDGRKRKGKE